MTDATDRRLEATVRGTVQGVGFRYFVRREASRLGVRGWVANESDGSVSVVAEGEEGALEHLLRALTRGPSGAVVRDVQTAWSDARDEFSAFRVRSGAHSGD